MKRDAYCRIAIIIGMVAVMCGTVSAGVGISVQTQATSVGEYPVCTAPCECISESTAAMRWGAEGYEKCSKTICGQDNGGNVQYYCIHQVGGTVAASATAIATGTMTPKASAAATAAVQDTMVQAPGTSLALPGTPSSTWPAADAVPQKTPAGIFTLFAATGVALLVSRGMRRN